MSRTVVRITKRLLEASTTTEGDHWDSDIAGFHVRVGARGISFRVAYQTVTGKRRVQTLGRHGVMTLEEARKAARKVLASVVVGMDPRQEQEETKKDRMSTDPAMTQETAITLGEYLEGPYTVYQNRRKDGYGTLRRIKKDFASWLSLPMMKLSRTRLEKWQAEEEEKDRPRAFLTLKRSFDALHGLLVHAHKRKVIPSNPLVGVKLQKPALSEEDMIKEADRRYLEESEVRRLFIGLDRYQGEKRKQRASSRCHGKHYLPCLDKLVYVDYVKPYVLIMYYTGFRQGDLHGLHWEHINFHFKTIRKVIEKTAHHKPKPQTFPMSNHAVEVLMTWHKHCGEPDKGYVFPSAVTGRRLDKNALRRPWITIRKLGGIDESLSMYTLRHNFASQLVMAGVDLLSVSKLMSHSDIQTTVKHYAHLKPDHTRNAVESFSLAVESYGADDMASEVMKAS
ncbi:MAG: tyrosine-type recombinase/integrase [Pseudomonadota bacterium]